MTEREMILNILRRLNEDFVEYGNYNIELPGM